MIFFTMFAKMNQAPSTCELCVTFKCLVSTKTLCCWHLEVAVECKGFATTEQYSRHCVVTVWDLAGHGALSHLNTWHMFSHLSDLLPAPAYTLYVLIEICTPLIWWHSSNSRHLDKFHMCLFVQCPYCCHHFIKAPQSILWNAVILWLNHRLTVSPQLQVCNIDKVT